MPSSPPCPAGVPLPQYFVPSNTFATAGNDGSVRLWRLSSSTSSRQRHMYSKDMLHCIRVAGDADRPPRVSASAMQSPQPGDTRLTCLTVSCDGGVLAVADGVGAVHVVSTATMSVASTVPGVGEGCQVRCMEFCHRHSGTLFVGYRDQYIRVYHCGDGGATVVLTATVLLHGSPLTSLRLAGDDASLFSSDADSNMVLSRVTLPVAGPPQVHKYHSVVSSVGTVTDAAVDRNGQTLVTVGESNGAVLWLVKRLTAPLRAFR